MKKFLPAILILALFVPAASRADSYAYTSARSSYAWVRTHCPWSDVYRYRSYYGSPNYCEVSSDQTQGFWCGAHARAGARRWSSTRGTSWHDHSAWGCGWAKQQGAPWAYCSFDPAELETQEQTGSAVLNLTGTLRYVGDAMAVIDVLVFVATSDSVPEPPELPPVQTILGRGQVVLDAGSISYDGLFNQAEIWQTTEGETLSVHIQVSGMGFDIPNGSDLSRVSLLTYTHAIGRGQTPGACCRGDGTCTVMIQADCEAAGWVYQGDGTTCEPNPCPPAPEGACCYADGSCTYSRPDECAATGGFYQGDWVTCDPNPCLPIPVLTKTWGQIKDMYNRGDGSR